MADRLPADWEPHSGTIVAWPGRPDVWDEQLTRGRNETDALVRAIARDEQVWLVAAPGAVDSVRGRFEDDDGVSVIDIELDDSWARDISPLFTVGCDGNLTANDFNFNAWGEKFRPYDRDSAFGRTLCSKFGIHYNSIDLVLEGGSITTDGRGSAIVVESTILNNNRNPASTRGVVESLFEQSLGVTNTIWLPFGLTDDSDTDGHVDNVAVFCAPGRILVQVGPTKAHPDAERLEANLKILRNARDIEGRPFEIVEVPWLPVSRIDARRPSSYVNSYPTNRAVIVPVVGSPNDDDALALVSEAYGGRPPVAIVSDALAWGGGGPHCMTMQVPQNNQERGVFK